MGKQIQNYLFQVELGSGVYSKVYKAINIITKQEVAIKMVKAYKFKEMPKLEEGTINEINTLTSLKPCPNIIRYYDMLKTVNNYYFVYEYCNGGTLEKLLKNQKNFPEKQCLIYFGQLLNAFKILAENNVMHRDIKPENILIHNGALKIADFGFCKPLKDQDSMAQTMLGSPIYMAPEVLKGEQYTMKADIWSLGVVLYRMLYGFCPYESNNIGKLILLLNENELRIPQNPPISPVLEELVRRMLTKDPKKRADWSEVLSFELTEHGQIFDKKALKTHYSLKSSNQGTNESSSKASSIKQQTEQKIRRVRKVQSPEHYDGRGEMNFNKIHLQQEPSQRQNLKSSSPFRGPINHRNSTKEMHIKNHRKCIQLTSMIMELMSYHSIDAVSVGYFLCKSVEKQFLMLRESVRKQGIQGTYNNNSQYSQDYKLLNNMSLVIEQELKAFYELIFYFQQVLHENGIHQQDAIENKKYFLKKFIMSLRNLQQKQQISLCHQLLDYILEDIFINKKTYEKLNCQQMHKKIKERIQEIN